MKEKVIKYCEKQGIEVKKNQGGGINVYVAWENRGFEKHLKKLNIKYSMSSDSNFDYRIYSIY